MGLTPMMKQYLEIHERVSDSLLFFRLGDFYELFFDDALTASRVLELTLTGRECGLDEKAPMCGVPYHAVDSYIARLVEKGYKVAICEQMEDAVEKKGIVHRDIVRIVTPGTILDTNSLDAQKNNYLMSVYMGKNGIGIAYVDVLTGEFLVSEINSLSINLLLDEISKVNPSEILLNNTLYQNKDFKFLLNERFKIMITLLNSRSFELKKNSAILVKQFKVFSLLALGLEDKTNATIAAGTMLTYLFETQKKSLTHINHLYFYELNAFMNLDLATRRNLELTETMRNRDKIGSLFGVLDKSATAMGSRELRKWIEAPLLNAEIIKERQKSIGEFLQDPSVLKEIKGILEQVYDLERICGKISFGTVTPKDLLALKQSISTIGSFRELFEELGISYWKNKFNDCDDLIDIINLINMSIHPEAGLSIKDGWIINAGYNFEIDELREATINGKNWIINLEQGEREKTGIRNLKIKYNRVFGYYLEVSKSNVHLVPENYIRKQTLSNAERYYIPELKELEEKILGAQDSLLKLEMRLFQEIRETILLDVERIQKCAKDIACCDAIYALAKSAYENGYVCPELNDNGYLEIVGGRHPVVESLIESGTYITNDCKMDINDERLMILTGPNMAGKSTYIRQVAIITLMAQFGSYVPVEYANIPITDRIFTRVGASDDLATGQSTFMIEMTEVSNILKNATKQSLVILDEIGRGTSTFDGISIAWAVVEYLLNKIGVKTLFATHYHELIELEQIHSGIINSSIRVKETKDGVVFLRKIQAGGVDKSYGIEVARLAGFPEWVIHRSEEILHELEMDKPQHLTVISDSDMQKNQQMHFWDERPLISNEEMMILDELKSLTVNDLTPIDAINLIYKFTKSLQ